MTTYNLKEVEEASIGMGGYNTTVYLIPIDSQGNPVTDYQWKDRVLKNGQMIVFDTRQEYLDYLAQPM